MNLLKHSIIEVHGTKEFGKYPNMIEVDVTYNCYGDIKRTKHITDKQQWQKDMEVGFFLA